MDHGAWPLTGRDRELTALGHALADGTCCGVLLHGGPGFGKTRLAAAALDAAARQGRAVASVRATKAVADIPYAGLGPLFDQLGIDPAPGTSLPTVVGAAVDAARGDHRFVLAVDDVRDLDDASATLVDHLRDLGNTFLISTMRTAGPDDGGQFRRLHIGELDREAIQRLAVTALGDAVEGSSLQRLVDASNGNPLLLRQLIDGAQESGALTRQEGLWCLTGSLAEQPLLRDLMKARHAGLQPAQLEALELVALSDPLDLALLERLVPFSAVEALEERTLIEAVEGETGIEVHLSHPLHGEVLRGELPGIRRTRLCRALAGAAGQSAPMADAGAAQARRAMRLAVWQLDGGTIGTEDSMLAAARTALRSGDQGLALRLGRAAWQRWRSPEAALIAGDMLDLLGHSRDAADLLAEAYALATTDRQRVSLTVRRAAVLFRSLADAEAADTVINDAAAIITDRSGRRELDALKGDHLLLGGDVRRAIELITPIVEHPEDDAAFAQSSLDYGTALAMAGRTGEALEHTGHALEIRRNLDDEEQLSTVGVYLVAQVLANLHAGNLAEAEAIGDLGYQVSLQRGDGDGQAWFSSIMGLVRLAQGRPSTALTMFRESATVFRRLHHPGESWGLAGIALAAAHLGERPVGAQAIADLDALTPSPVRLQAVSEIRARAWTLVAHGELSRAQRLLWDAVELGERWGQLAAAAEALHDLVRLGQAPSASERLLALAERLDGPFVAARAAFARASQLRSVDLAGEAADQFEAIGAQLFAAESACLESTLATRAGLDRRAAAASARADALLVGCEGATTPALARTVLPAPLTAREREIALLAALDLTSRDIAERLHLSTRTVENHLQKVYGKLGIRGRPELTDRLARI